MQTPDGVFRYNNVNHCYASILGTVMAVGESTRPRGQETRELRGVTLQINNPNDNVLVSPARKPNYSFMVAEWLWIMTGCALRGAILPFNKNLDMAADEIADGRQSPTFAGAYGPKWIEQMPYILQTLTQDPESRQAIVNIWRDRPRQSADQPCTLNWQFFIRNDKLEMHAHMRSNDLWLGTPYDLFNFTQIQRWVAWMLKKEVGPYYHHVGSLHIYERNFEGVEKVIAEGRGDGDGLRYSGMKGSPDLHILLNTLLEAASWRESPASQWFPDHVSRQTQYISQLTPDLSFRLIPLLLHISTSSGVKFFLQHHEVFTELARNTPWERPLMLIKQEKL